MSLRQDQSMQLSSKAMQPSADKHHDRASRASAQALTWGSPGFLDTARQLAAPARDAVQQSGQGPGMDLVICADCVYGDQAWPQQTHLASNPEHAGSRPAHAGLGGSLGLCDCHLAYRQ